MASVFGKTAKESRARLALGPSPGLTTKHPLQLDRTDHVSPCPQSAGATMQGGADHLPGRVLMRASGHG
jgi:hypothetical protein